jgi:uncharacterized membrane protein
MTRFTSDAEQSIHNICNDIEQKTVANLVLKTRPLMKINTLSSQTAVLIIAVVSIIVGGLVFWAGSPIATVLLTQATATAVTFAGLLFYNYRKTAIKLQTENLQDEAVACFRQLAATDEDRKMNVLLFLCENHRRLHFIVGDSIADVVPSSLWSTIADGFEKQAGKGDLEQAVVSTMKTIALLLEVSAPKLPLDKDAPVGAVAQTVSAVCGSIFSQNRQISSPSKSFHRGNVAFQR